jgi:hypothetical protein
MNILSNEPLFGQNGTLFVLPSVVLAYASQKNQLDLLIGKKRPWQNFYRLSVMLGFLTVR